MSKFADLPDNAVDYFRAHIKLYLEDPEKAHFWDASPVGGPSSAPTLLLTTTGRKTGRERHTPLLYVENEGSYLVMGSKGGTENHPFWYLNLLDNPDCEIRVASFRSKARAVVLEGEERASAWAKVTALQPVYLKYQKRTDRLIPVIRLEPVSG
jgi:deazaflavin-dependent oxidoreductase (nitroreductase family)